MNSEKVEMDGDNYCLESVAVETLKSYPHAAMQLVIKFCNTQKAIQERHPLAPIAVYLAYNANKNMIIFVEHHQGILLTQLAATRGIRLVKQALTMLYEQLKELHRGVGFHGGVYISRLWYDEPKRKISTSHWDFYTETRIFKYEHSAFIGPYSKALNLRQMRRLDSLDLLALIWAFADAVAICNKMKELPSRVYEYHMLDGLSKTTVKQEMEQRSLTGNLSLDSILLNFHKREWIK